MFEFIEDLLVILGIIEYPPPPPLTPRQEFDKLKMSRVCLNCGYPGDDKINDGICFECGASYRYDLEFQRFPDPLKNMPEGMPAWLIMPSYVWGRIRQLESLGPREGRSLEEVRADVFALAERWRPIAIEEYQDILQRRRWKEEEGRIEPYQTY